MKAFLTPTDVLAQSLKPAEESENYEQTIRPYLPYLNQNEFNKFLNNCGFEETGNISQMEIDIIKEIKEELKSINFKNQDVDVDRLEFDYSVAFHRGLKKLGWGKYMLDDLGMWRYLSLNFFKEEVFNRRGKTLFEKGDHVKAAKATFDHLFGLRARDIFPRRYFIIGERLYDKNKGYFLLENLASIAKKNKGGGFGNLIANLIETRLLSPQDYVSKTMSKTLFLGGKLANDKEVAKSFARYNGFKTRLINDAHEDLFKNEICILSKR